MSLLDTASLILTPNGYKASKLYSVKPTDASGDMTVVRATTATRVNSAGVIESVAINVPRLDYTNASCPSILVEPARTNSVLYSNDLSQAVWSKTNYALTSATSIQGLTTTRITKNATSNGVYKNSQARTLNTIATFAAGTKTLTWLIRKGNTDKVGFLINNVLVGVLTSVSCEFDFTTQTFTNISLGLTASFENPTTDVYKIILTINDIGVSTSKAIWIAPIDNSNNTFDGGYLDFAFAQWEAGSNATSYIPTVAATVTRNADVISRNNIYTNGLLSASGGTWFVELKNNFVYTRDNTNININLDASSGFTNGFLLRNLGVGRLSIQKTISGSTTSLYLTTADTSKIAIKWNGATADVFENGTKVVTATVFTTTQLQSILIQMQVPVFIKQMALFPTPLSDPQCENLTA